VGLLKYTSEQNSDDIGELKSLVVGLTGTPHGNFCFVLFLIYIFFSF
jgi:hypothetical protein